MKEIYLAGGCFWGVEGYFRRIDGIEDVKVGYANGKTEEANYQNLKITEHAETVKIIYREQEIDLETILEHYFRIIDPTSLDQQGHDKGRQYRTGIYYTDEKDLPVIQEFYQSVERLYQERLMVEVEKLQHFILAEDYHQDYLGKNPNGYCHIPLHLAFEPLVKIQSYVKKSKVELEKDLTELQYLVTQKAATELAYENEYWSQAEEGIYVDITTGEPLFSSKDKFDSGCGWPSFSKAFSSGVLRYYHDESHGMKRIEVKSRIGDAHLGHVFEDGPKKLGGLRYCINSASLCFIPLEKMEEEGYGEYVKYIAK